jgi:methyl-accepting chemotaxis protein
MPQRVRWEAELLTLELESLHTVVQASADVNQFTDSFAVVADEFDHLPEELRAQTEDLLKGIEQLQPEFQATLAQGEKMVAEVREATKAVETLTPKVQEVVATTNETLLILQPVLKEIRQIKGEPDPNKAPLDTMAVLEQSNTLAHQSHAIVTELRQLLTELKAPLGPTSSVVETKQHARELIDVITWRVILVVVIFACAMMAVILFKRLISTRNVSVGPK